MHNFKHLSQGAKGGVALVVLLLLAAGLYFYTTKAAPRMGDTVESCAYIVNKWKEAYVADAAPKTIYDGTIAEVNFEGVNYPQIDRLKNGITRAAQGGANFAGNFAIVEWGCGSNCQEHAVVDVQSGNIIAMGIPSEAGLQFLPEENIIITNPAVNFPPTDVLEAMTLDDQIYWYNLPREYYVLEERGDSALVRRICIENPFDGN